MIQIELGMTVADAFDAHSYLVVPATPALLCPQHLSVPIAGCPMDGYLDSVPLSNVCGIYQHSFWLIGLSVHTQG